MFKRILIANRGEIALRIQRTCHRMGIPTVALYADPDRLAPFVRDADEAIYIGPPVASGSFLAIDKILDAAAERGVDAVHPGYGFLAENSAFAAACAERGITFIGPGPDAIERMGNKSLAKDLAREAGVPVIPGFSARDVPIADILARAGDEVGFPLMVKAAYGGGGKGMRIVHDAKDLRTAIESAAREATAAFGRDELLLERYITTPRHVEVQIFGDTHGSVLHLFERECSIQRRHQKVVEEAPSPTIRPETRDRMTAAAVALGRHLGYVNAGTVEFVVGPDDDFYFLEVNTRLQVEHPVTEMITGLDLVRLQIEIAGGAPLPFAQADLAMHGHAIEVRVCAEDPANDFLPAIGRIVRWEAPPLEGVRYDSGVETGTEITIHYDPLLAKVIAHGSDRNEAARRLRRALRRLRLDGLRNNLSFLDELLGDGDFLAAKLDTGFLDRHPNLATAAPSAATLHDHVIAAALWGQAERRRNATVLATLPSGWRNNPTQKQHTTFRVGDHEIPLGYRALGNNRFHVDVGSDVDLDVLVVEADADGISLEIGPRRRRYQLVEAHGRWFVHSTDGRSEIEELPRFTEGEAEDVSGGCQASMPGRILKVLVAEGAEVAKGDPLVVMEAMKMEHQISAPTAGRVAEVRVAEGDQVNAGDILVVVEPLASEGTK
jgi:acetyl/propionyl-CoA carboxylase alpha subunit